MNRLEVNKYAVSSTTTCEYNYDKVITEMQSLIEIDGDKVIPVLWISPDFFLNNSVLDIFLNSGITWKCIKIHPDWQPYVWNDISNQKQLLDLALSLKLPIMIHTGGQQYSEANVWEELIKNNCDLNFILAHCRPFDQAFSIISKHHNAYGDLSFVESSNFHRLHKSQICNRILWGSDFPIYSFYINVNIQKYYTSRINELKNAIDDDEFTQITLENFNNLFTC